MGIIEGLIFGNVSEYKEGGQEAEPTLPVGTSSKESFLRPRI
jgi:hypothetical protein